MADKAKDKAAKPADTGDGYDGTPHGGVGDAEGGPKDKPVVRGSSRRK